jgi:hypothetical protein
VDGDVGAACKFRIPKRNAHTGARQLLLCSFLIFSLPTTGWKYDDGYEKPDTHEGAFAKHIDTTLQRLAPDQLLERAPPSTIFLRLWPQETDGPCSKIGPRALVMKAWRDEERYYWFLSMD